MFFPGPSVSKPQNAVISFTYKKGVVGIYGNSEGLKYLGQLCINLAENPQINHIHLDKSVPGDTLLTEDSLIAFISILENKKQLKDQKNRT